MSTDIYAMVTDKILAALAAGTVPWTQPWDSRIGMPLSMATGKPYRGINVLLLTLGTSYDSPYWGTYKKITELGGQVRKGEKSTMVTLWKTGSREQTVDGQVETKRWAILRYYLVFNACQADGLPEKFTTAPGGHSEHEPIEAAEALLQNYVNTPTGPSFTTGLGQGAFYQPGPDRIVVPPLLAYGQPEEFYSTAFHEVTHSTGHKSRLAREGVIEGHTFGDEAYSKEELIAEMGAAMLCGTCGIDQAVRARSASYIRNWMDVLRGDTKLVVTAAGAAQRACDHVLGTTFNEQEAAA